MTPGTEVGVAQDVLVEENITDNSSHRSLRSEDIDGKDQLRPCCSPQQEQLGDDGIAVCHDPRDYAKASRCLLRPENLDGWIGVETAVTIREVRKDDDFIRELQSQCNGWSNQKYKDALKSNLPIHLREMFEEAGDSLNRQQLLSLFQVLKSKVSVFSKGDTDLGNFTAVKHRINTGDAKPIKQRTRRTPLGYANEERQHLEKLLEADVIESSSSEWASPSVLVRKRDGSVRWCIDMRKLNDVTVKDCFPLPLIEDCLDALAGCQYFTTLDMASGYYQLEVEEQDRDKTAFVTKYGLFSFKRMPFGFCNAPATFSRAISLVLKGLAWTSVIAFLDDIVVLGKDFDSHITNLTSVMDRLEQYGLKLKPKKCQLLKSSVIFLGKCVSSEGVQVPTHDIDRVVNWTRPACKRDVQSFIGVMNFHRDHIPSFATIAKPLYDVMSPKSTFEWTADQQQAFDLLKQKMTTAPVLAYPNPDDLFILDTDASNHAIGAELLQVQNGTERLIGFGSFVFDRAQRKYCTTRKELLAVVRFTRHFKHYLLGRRFVVRTDHNSLTWLMGFRNIEGQLARWIEELSSYDMQIVHRAGKDHVNADGLSRIPDSLDMCNCYTVGSKVEDLPCGGCKYCVRAHGQWDRFRKDLDDVVPLAVRSVAFCDNLRMDNTWVDQFSSEDLRDMQMKDETVGQLLRWIEADYTPSQADLALASPAVKYFWLLRRQLVLISGVVYYRQIDVLATQPEKVLVTPATLHRMLLEHCHDLPGAGHMGMNKTLERLKRYAIWYKMQDSYLVYVKGCQICNRQKKPHKKAKAPHVSYHAGSPLERVHIDILGPLIETPRENQYVLVVVDQFTKWVECYPLPSQTAERVASTFVTEFVNRLGCPLELHSDQGRNFESHFFKRLCDMLEIAKTRTTPYRPSANGQVERMNRTILQILRCFIRGEQTDWDLHLGTVGTSIRATVNLQTGFTPNFLMLGREVMQPIDLMFHANDRQATHPPRSYIERHCEAMRTAHQIARENLQQSQKRQKRDYDMKTEQNTYSVGDAVYKFNKAVTVGQCSKLQPVWLGPWIVVEVISSVLYRITNRKRSMVTHHDSLKLCGDRELPIWFRRKRNKLLGTDPELFGVLEGDLVNNDWNGNLGLEELFTEESNEGQGCQGAFASGNIPDSDSLAAHALEDGGCRVGSTRDSAVDSNSNCEDTLAAHDLEDGGCRVGSTRDSAVDSNSNCEDALAAHDLEDGGCRVGSTRDSAVDSNSNRSVAPAADNWQQIEEGFDSDDQDVDGQAFQDVT